MSSIIFMTIEYALGFLVEAEGLEGIEDDEDDSPGAPDALATGRDDREGREMKKGEEGALLAPIIERGALKVDPETEIDGVEVE
jgi:hypothetical protein